MYEEAKPRATPGVGREVVIGVNPRLSTALARRIYANAVRFDAHVSIVAKQGSASAHSLFA